MKKIPTWLTVFIFMGLLIASKFLFFAKKDDKANISKNSMPIGANYTVVHVSTLSNRLSVMGKVGAFNQVDISPEISGKITAIYFKEGDYVKAGTVMIKLNDADMQAQLTKVRAQLKLAEVKLLRLKQLLQVKGVSQEEFDMQESDYQVLKADEAYQLAQLAKTSVTAPFSGVAGLKRVSLGSFVNANTPMVSLVEMNPLYIEFSLPQKYADLVQNGQSVEFKLEDARGDFDLKASVFAIEPQADESTKTIKVRASFTAGNTIHPGVFVMVNIQLNANANAFMLPTQCVVPTLKGQKLFVYKNGAAKETPVHIGIRNEETIQILDGVTEGDTVLTTGLLGIKKDSKIKLLKASR